MRAVQILQQGNDHFTRPEVQVPGGLVSEQDTRRGGKRTSQSHPLPLATGQLRRKLRGLICNAKPLQ